MNGPRDNTWPVGALVALLAFTGLLSTHTVNRDTVPLTADASGYYRTTLTLDRHLSQGRLREAGWLLLKSGIRPPLPQLVTIAVYRVLGERSQRVARLSVVLFLWLLLLSTYAIGAKLRDRPTGLLAAALLACFPQVIGYSRCYWMDVPLAAMVALNIWALLRSEGLRRRGPSLLLGLTLGAGLLTKYSFPVFVVGPLSLTVITGLRRAHRLGRRPLRLRLENLLLCLLVTVLITAFWYVPSVEAAWDNFLFNQGAGALSPRTPWAPSNLTLYLRHLALTQLGLPFTVVLLVALPPFFFVRRHDDSRLLLLLWLAPPYLFFSFIVLGMEWARFTLPCLAAVALVVALSLMQFRFHLSLRAGCAALAFLGLLGYVHLTYASKMAPLRPGGFPMHRIGGRGLLTAEDAGFHVTVQRLIPPVKGRWTQVALAPDIANIGSVLETWALEERVRLRVSIPHEPEACSFDGRYRFPDRVSDPRYLGAFDYFIEVRAPRGVRLTFRKPSRYARFRKAWNQAKDRFTAAGQLRLENGVVLAVYRNRR
jgi:4-amino-4-deoxy-L-arabinose transferase-like glycosyltransferase